MLACSTNKVVIIDMPILKKNLPLDTKNQIVEVYNMTTPKARFVNCEKVGNEIEKYFEYLLNEESNKISTLMYTQRFEDFVNFFHGYHILNTVARSTNTKIYYIGLRPSISSKDLDRLQHYIEVDIDKELNFISKKLLDIKPDIVNLSGSESIDVNESFFIKEGMNKKIAYKTSKIIFDKWNNFWKKTISSLPNTRFIVSAGNGESDWVGDELHLASKLKTQTTPATIGLPNIVAVGSKNTKGLSLFSNYGNLVKEYKNGEFVLAQIPCDKKGSIKFTGTSQATAIHTNKLLKQ